MFQSSPLESKQLVIYSRLLILFMYFKNFDMLYIYVAHGRYFISFFLLLIMNQTHWEKAMTILISASIQRIFHLLWSLILVCVKCLYHMPWGWKQVTSIIQSKLNFKGRSPSWCYLGRYSVISIGNTSIKTKNKRKTEQYWLLVNLTTSSTCWL